MRGGLLLLLVLIPLIGALFAMLAKTDHTGNKSNVYNVSVWSMIFNIILILYIFSGFSIEKQGIQLVEKYKWMDFPPMELLLGADIFSLLLLLSINLSFVIGGICINRDTEHPKTLISAELLFISLLNGYFLSADIILFYIFFASLSAPLIILISTYGSIRKKNIMMRFSIYNLIGALFLFISVMMIYNYKGNNIPLNTVSNLNLVGSATHFIWIGIFFAFISRLPIWPFHYWITSINSSLRNPMVFMVGNLVPLFGLYGFIRFWPNNLPSVISVYAPVFELICVITMVFISMVSLSHKDIRYKLFAYTTVYYLLYLTGIFISGDSMKESIGYSLFAYIMIITVLSFLISHVEYEKKKLNIYGISGILCYMPRASKCISLFILAGIGLPITSLFWNNFIIISEIFNYSLVMGTFTILSLFIVALSLLEELFKLKDKSYAQTTCSMGTDLSNLHFSVYLGCLLILFFSFFKPLWFVF